MLSSTIEYRMKTLTRKGFTLTIPTDFRKDAYIRCRMDVTDPTLWVNADRAWDDGVAEVYKLFGKCPTEDGTVGQAAQTSKGLKVGTVFSFGVNLYGAKVRMLHQRVAEAV